MIEKIIWRRATSVCRPCKSHTPTAVRRRLTFASCVLVVCGANSALTAPPKQPSAAVQRFVSAVASHTEAVQLLSASGPAAVGSASVTATALAPLWQARPDLLENLDPSLQAALTLTDRPAVLVQDFGEVSATWQAGEPLADVWRRWESALPAPHTTTDAIPSVVMAADGRAQGYWPGLLAVVRGAGLEVAWRDGQFVATDMTTVSAGTSADRILSGPLLGAAGPLGLFRQPERRESPGPTAVAENSEPAAEPSAVGWRLVSPAAYPLVGVKLRPADFRRQIDVATPGAETAISANPVLEQQPVDAGAIYFWPVDRDVSLFDLSPPVWPKLPLGSQVVRTSLKLEAYVAEQRIFVLAPGRSRIASVPGGSLEVYARREGFRVRVRYGDVLTPFDTHFSPAFAPEVCSFELTSGTITGGPYPCETALNPDRQECVHEISWTPASEDELLIVRLPVGVQRTELTAEDLPSTNNGG